MSEAVGGSLEFDDVIFYSDLLTGCTFSEWGLWTKGSVFINKVFIYWGRKWIVKILINLVMGFFVM